MATAADLKVPSLSINNLILDLACLISMASKFNSANIRIYEYWPVGLESIMITQHISSIVIFFAVYSYLYLRQLSPYVLIGMGTAGTVAGCIV